jgi:hypothetical protein
LIVEHERHIVSTGFDHLGFLLDSPAEVNAMFDACRAWQARDSRVQIKLRDDPVLPAAVTHAFYVRYGLPLEIDVQHIAYEPGKEPTRAWQYRYSFRVSRRSVHRRPARSVR